MSSSDSVMVSVNRDDLALVLDGSQPKDTLRVHQYVHLAAMRLRAVLDAPSEPEGPPSPTPSLPDPSPDASSSPEWPIGTSQ